MYLLLFLLRQVFTDDEALTKLLHFGRSLARSITFRISHPLSFMSSSTLSIHFFLGLPLLLKPSTSPCSTFAGILSFSILITCPWMENERIPAKVLHGEVEGLRSNFILLLVKHFHQ